MKNVYKAARQLFAISALTFVGFAVPANAGTFSFTLTKNAAYANHSVLSGAGVWMYTYAVRGKVTNLQINIKNYAPGAADFCSNFDQRQPISGTHNTNLIPAADYQACGTQWVDPDRELWMVAYLHTADSKAVVDVTVTYPDP